MNVRLSEIHRASRVDVTEQIGIALLLLFLCNVPQMKEYSMNLHQWSCPTPHVHVL